MILKIILDQVQQIYVDFLLLKRWGTLGAMHKKFPMQFICNGEKQALSISLGLSTEKFMEERWIWDQAAEKVVGA